MGRTEMKCDGAQRRTIFCKCGWSYRGIPDRQQSILNLHSKRCDYMKDIVKDLKLPKNCEIENNYSERTPKGTNVEALCHSSDTGCHKMKLRLCDISLD